MQGDNGRKHLQGEEIFARGRDQEAQLAQLIDEVCRRDKVQLFADHGASLPSGWEAERPPLLAALAGDHRAPVRILGRPVDPGAAERPYVDMGEGDLLSQKYMREAMPFLFD